MSAAAKCLNCESEVSPEISDYKSFCDWHCRLGWQQSQQQSTRGALMSHTEYQCSTKNCTGTVLIANVPGNEDNHLDAECDRCDQKRRSPSFTERERANRQWMWGENGTNPLPVELMPDPPEENEGWDVCNDVDDEFEN